MAYMFAIGDCAACGNRMGFNPETPLPVLRGAVGRDPPPAGQHSPARL
jgi:hypothetical protein